MHDGATVKALRIGGLVGALVAVLLAWLEISAVARHLLDPDDPLVRLQRAPDERERARGLTRGVAKLSAAPGATFGACRVQYKRKKSGNWHHLADGHGGSRVTFDAGAWQIAASTRVDFGEWTPDPLGRDPDKAEMKRFLTGIGEGSNDDYLQVFCLRSDEVVHVYGCAGPAQTIVPCAGESAVVVSPGRSATPIVAWLRARVVASIAGAAMSLLLFATMLRLVLRVSREIVPTLAAHARGRGRSRFLPSPLLAWVPLGVGTVVFLPLRFGLFDVSVSAWFALIVALVLLVPYTVWGIGRMRDVALARSVVARAATTPLHSAPTGERCELALRITADAPLVVGPDGLECAAYRISVAEDPVDADMPGVLPVEDTSGRGFLDLRDCVIDPGLGVVERILGRPQAEQLLAEAGVSTALAVRVATVTWFTLAPGDRLLVYGVVERLSPAELGVEPGGSYRAGAQLPAVRGRSGEVFVYRGDEAPLLRSLLGELVGSTVLLLVLVTTFAGTVATLARLP